MKKLAKANITHNAIRILQIKYSTCKENKLQRMNISVLLGTSKKDRMVNVSKCNVILKLLHNFTTGCFKY